jgi:hypothetical protein
MQFSTKDLDWAVETNVISGEVRQNLQVALEKRHEQRPSLTLSNVLYYLGGMIVISAMTIYTTLAWEDLSGLGHLGIALAYATVFIFVGRWLWESKGLIIPGGLLITAAVCMTPMAVYGVQELMGWWVMGDPGTYRDFFHWIEGGWAIMEIATIIAGLVALRFFKFSFITMPIAFSLWFVSMDLVSMLYGAEYSWEQRRLVSLWFGLLIIVASYVVDRRTREDYAFWGYLFGVAAFWCGLTWADSSNELGKFAYCMINVGLMAISVLLQRRVFIVFGAMGVMSYIGHLTFALFKDEMLFSFGLSIVGLIVIGLGVLYHRHAKSIEQWLLKILPENIRKTLPQYR